MDRDERVFEVVIDGVITAFRADSDDDKHRWLSAVRAALSRHDAVSRELDASLLGHRPAARERAMAAARANESSGQTAPPPPPPKSADHVLVLCDVERASGKPQRRHSSPVRKPGPPLPAEIAVVERAAAAPLAVAVGARAEPREVRRFAGPANLQQQAAAAVLLLVKPKRVLVLVEA